MSEKYRLDLLRQQNDKKIFLTKIEFNKKKVNNKLTELEKELDSNFKELKVINNMLNEQLKRTEGDRVKGFSAMQTKIDNLQKKNNDILKDLKKCTDNSITKDLQNTKTKLENFKIKKDLRKCISSKNSSIFHKYAVMKEQLKKNNTN